MELKQRQRTKEMIIYLLMYLLYFVCLLEYFRDQERVVSAQIPAFEVSRTRIQSYDPSHYVAKYLSFQCRLWNQYKWIRSIRFIQEALFLQSHFTRTLFVPLRSGQIRERRKCRWVM